MTERRARGRDRGGGYSKERKKREQREKKREGMRGRRGEGRERERDSCIYNKIRYTSFRAEYGLMCLRVALLRQDKT